MLDDGSGAPIVVVNGKIMLGLDLHDTLAAHAAAGAEATMVLRPDPEATTWGSLQVDDRGRVVRLLQAVPDRDPEAQPVGDPLMFTGVQVLEPRFLDRVPPEGEQCVVRTAYRSLFHEGMGLHGYVTRDYWWEHSTPARYRQGVFNVLGGTFDPPFATAPVRGVHPEASVHPDAQIVAPVRLATGAKVEAGARVGPHVELGRGTVVKTGVTVQRAVVWDDAVVDADTSDAIVVP
jgi:NDP-sugar pyrophosphorylase family protein